MSRRQMLCCALLILSLMVLPVICLAGPPGKITLKDGSQIYGEIVEMTEGKLQVKALFHDGEDPITIKWSEVAGIDSKDPMSFVLGNGPSCGREAGYDAVREVGYQNRVFTRPHTCADGLDFGGSVTSGNTDVKNFSFVGELVTRSERLRLSMLGRYL